MLRGDIYAFESSHCPALLAAPEIFQQNRLPFHAHFADQTSPEMPLTVSLDGEWNFRYAENLTVPDFIQMQSLQKPGQPYGGDFGDRPTDREFCMDGLVLPDRCALFQRGVGGDNSWGAKPHEEACLAVETGMTFSFSIQKRNR